MKRFSRINLSAAALGIALLSVAGAQAEVSKDTLESIPITDTVRTPLGELKFFDGVPTEATADTVYDNLNRMRGL